MSDPKDLIRKAQNYVTASNGHDISAIEPMLADDCRYTSSGVGEHRGKNAILDMMQAFFSANPEVHWDAANYRLEPSDCVVFEFAITLRGTASHGVERIAFNQSGKISRIEVAR